MLSAHSSDTISDLSQHVVEAMCKAIVHGAKDDELFDMFVDTDTFKNIVLNWKHPKLQINLFQFAIIYDRNSIVQFLGLRCPEFLNERTRYTFSDEMPETEIIEIFVNCPLHLACWIGSLDIMKFLLTNNSGFSVKDVSVLMLKKHVTLEHGKKTTLFEKLVDPLQKGNKPFEVCISEKHLNCIMYLMKHFVIPCQSFTYLYAGLDDHASLLHKACSFGCGPLVLLLLETFSKSVIHLSDHTGKQPIHIAVWNGDTETIHHLLDYGANPNALCKTKSCLHIMYRSYFNIPSYVENTTLLIQYGINVKMVDDAGNSALHVLAEQLHMNIAQIKMLKKVQCATKGVTTTCTCPNEYTLEMYHKDLIQCFRLLIANGADTNSKNSKGDSAFDVLLGSTLLSSALNEPWIYKAAELLLEHEPPILWSRFIINHLSYHNKREDKEKIVSLLCQHGGDVDNREPTEGILIELCYPAILSIQNRVPVCCVKMMINYMSIRHLKEVITILCSTVLPELQSRASARNVYVNKLVSLIGDVHMRSLRHLCKTTILVSLDRQSKRCSSLPLPRFLKNYIMSSEF